MKILFMGTPDFACTALKALYESGADIIGVVTQPDKPKGRGYVLTSSAVKQYALENGIAVYQPTTLRDESFATLLHELSPELIAVVAYGKILPQNVLDFSKYGCINVHGSLLPKYRGAAPIQHAIIGGEIKTGITTMYMEAGIDTGDMLEVFETIIEEDDNFETLHDRLAKIGATALISTIDKIANGSISRLVQNNTLATYAAKIEKTDCFIDFNHDVVDIHNKIRGLSPLPLAFAKLNDGVTIKFVSSMIIERETQNSNVAGSVIDLDATKGIISIACGKGTIGILTLLPEGKSRMGAGDFIRGRKINVGDTFTERIR